MTTYTGTLTGSGTLTGTGALSGVTETISQQDVVTEDLVINAGGTYTGTEDQIITTTVTLTFPGEPPTTTSSTQDTGEQQVSGNVNTANTSTSTVTVDGATATETTTQQFSSDQSTITVSGTTTYNSSTFINGSFGLAGTLSESGAPAPNLVFTSFASSSSSALYDGIVPVSYTLTNNGPATAAPSQVDIYFSTSPILDTATATLLGEISFGALAAGSQITENVPINLNSELPPNKDYYIFLYVNDNNDIAQAGPQPITIVALFTPGPDQVNFDLLTPYQKLAIIDGANVYNGLGGNDTVILPSEANSSQDIGDNQVLNWSPFLPFDTGSRVGDTYSITGSDGNYLIQCGAGSDNVTINQNGPTQNGSATIITGSGSDNISIIGNGNNGITVGTGSPTITLDGNGDNLIQVYGNAPDIHGSITTIANPNIGGPGYLWFQFIIDGTDNFDATLNGDGEFIVSGGTLVINTNNNNFTGPVAINSATLELTNSAAVGSGSITFVPDPAGQLSGTLQIDSTTMPSNVIMDFFPDTNDTIDLRGVGYTAQGSATLLSGNVLQITENGQSYDLHLNPAQDFAGDTFNLSSDGAGGTNITLSGAGPTPTAMSIQNDYDAITRTDLSSAQATAEANAIGAGTTTGTQYVDGLLSQVANTTIPAVAVEASMYGATGTSAEITSLVTNYLPAQVQNAIVNGYNPQIYACETLGLVFAFGNGNGSTAFATNFGPSNTALPATAAGDAEFAAAAASLIFGPAETANTVPAIEQWVANWEAFYTANGIAGVSSNPTAQQIDLAARGAAWGDAIGLALFDNLGPFGEETTNFLGEAAQGTAVYSASLLSPPAAAITITPVALFHGLDVSGNNSLWVTNGTAAGTYELTGISGASPTGLNPSDLTVFSNEVLFAGLDASGNNGLWVTNGTAAGTYELTGISGAFAGGILRYGGDLTVFNNEVLFGGIDASGVNGLWVTNGTAAGTYELTGISGARSNGIFNFSADGLPDFTVFNNEVLFAGLDASGNNGLWVTNGTAAGTSELTGISGAFAGGILRYGGDLTVFNNEVLFGGIDASGVNGLWVTNGTAVGTYELTGISGARSNGIFNFSADGLPDFTVFNNEVLFAGLDASGNNGLWVTNGTAAGTYELTGISGASPTGLSPSDLIVFSNEVLLAGKDASGQVGLWVTNGTAAGTHELTGISGASPTGLNPSDLTVFNNEVLFAGKDASGQVGLWVTNGTAAGTHELTGISGVHSSGVEPSAILFL